MINYKHDKKKNNNTSYIMEMGTFANEQEGGLSLKNVQR